MIRCVNIRKEPVYIVCLLKFRLLSDSACVFVCATTGQGDPPDNMKQFWRFLLRRNLPRDSLIHFKYGVIGLGDSTYLK